MNKKILFISHNGMTDPLGQAQVLPYLSNLAKMGFSITILSCEKKDKLEAEGERIGNTIAKAGIHWYTILFHDKIPFFSKMQDRYLLKRKAVQLYKEHYFDIIHCRSYIPADIGWQLKKKFGVKFIFDMRGFWADEKKDSTHWDVNKPIYRFIYKYYKRLEKKLLQQADAVVTLTHAAKVEMSKWNVHNLERKIYVIPCCADLIHFSNENIDSNLAIRLKKELGLNDAFPVLCYLGSLGEAYAINEMLYFFDRVKAQYPSSKFLFLTKDKAQLVEDRLQAFQNISLSDIYIQFASRKEIPTYLSLCTFSIFFYRPSYSRIACSPTKFAEISGLGLPIICNAVGDLSKEYLKGLPHIVINDLTRHEIDNSIPLIDKFRYADKNMIRDFAIREYDLKDGVRHYLSIYRLLTT